MVTESRPTRTPSLCELGFGRALQGYRVPPRPHLVGVSGRLFSVPADPSESVPEFVLDPVMSDPVVPSPGRRTTG